MPVVPLALIVSTTSTTWLPAASPTLAPVATKPTVAVSLSVMSPLAEPGLPMP